MSSEGVVSLVRIGEPLRSSTVRDPAVSESICVAGPGELRDGVRRASADRVWLLDGAVEPHSGALEALLAAAERGASMALSLPVDNSGDPIDRLLGRVDNSDPERLVAAVGVSTVPVRSGPLLSVLVDRVLASDLEPPRESRFGAYAGAEWITRALSDSGRGVLVPASRVSPRRPVPGSARGALLMWRCGGWGAGESTRELIRALSSRAGRDR